LTLFITGHIAHRLSAVVVLSIYSNTDGLKKMAKHI